jgi:GT2 family glycosyltransferase
MSQRLGYATDFLQAHPESVLVATNYVTTHTFGANISSNLLPHVSENHDRSVWLSAAKLYYSNPIIHSTVVFRRAMWEAVGGYDEQLSMCVDYDLFLRAMRVGKVALLPESTVLYFKNPRTFFKKKSHLEYLRTSFTTKRQAQGFLALPFGIRACDVIPVYLIARAVLRMSLLAKSQPLDDCDVPNETRYSH